MQPYLAQRPDPGDIVEQVRAQWGIRIREAAQDREAADEQRQSHDEHHEVRPPPSRHVVGQVPEADSLAGSIDQEDQPHEGENKQQELLGELLKIGLKLSVRRFGTLGP